MQKNVLDHGGQRVADLNPNPASLFPWIALDPADVIGKSAMTPAVSVDISREDGRNRTAQSKSNFVGLSAFPGIRMGSKRRQRTLHSGV